MRASPATGDLKVLLGAGLLVAAITVLGAVLSPPATDEQLRGSTFGAGPEGAKAAFLLLKRLGYRTERSFMPVADLALRPDDDLLVVASPAVSSSDADRRALARFVEAGGFVLATGHGIRVLPGISDVRRAGRRIVRGGGASAPHLIDSLEATTYTAVLPSPLTAGARQIRLTPEFVVGAGHHPYVPVYESDGTAGVLTASIGKGRVVWWTGSDALLNRTVDQPGHLEILLNALGPPGGRRVIWDEHAHGHARSLWSYLAGTPAPAAFAQLALLGLAGWLTFGLRRLPVRPLVQQARTSAMEFVDALASLYRKAGAAPGAVESARARTRRLLTTTAGLPPGVSDAQLAAAVSPRIGADASDIESTLHASAIAVENPSLAPRDALAIVQRLQDVAARVLRGVPGVSNPRTP